MRYLCKYACTCLLYVSITRHRSNIKYTYTRLLQMYVDLTRYTVHYRLHGMLDTLFKSETLDMAETLLFRNGLTGS
jgi:hypothetical protein